MNILATSLLFECLMNRGNLRTTIINIRQEVPPEKFVVDALVNDKRKTFRLEVVLPLAFSLTSKDSDFLDTFEYSMAIKPIVRLVLRTYRGEILDFPIDLGDV